MKFLLKIKKSGTKTKRLANTYEAKTHHNNLNFSIEFDSLGIIEDVEFKIEWKNIPELIKKI